MHSPSMEFLADRIDSFNERYALVENEKAVFSVEYVEFHWNEAQRTGLVIGNRYGIVRLARDLVLTAASGEGNTRDYATRFEEGSDEIIILKKRPSGSSPASAMINWDPATGLSETLYLEKILEAINSAINSLDSDEMEPARVEWDANNRAAFIIGPAFGLVLLARELIQFALSASFAESYEVAPLHERSGRIVLVLRDHH